MKPSLRKLHATLLRFCQRQGLYRLGMCLVHMQYLSVGFSSWLFFGRALAREFALSVLDLLHKRRECPLCRWQGWEFSPVFLKNNYRAATRCPCCLTFERHRIICARIPDHRILDARTRVLLIGPNQHFSRRLFNATQTCTLDIYPHNEASVLGNLSGLPFAVKVFDVVVCLRVLEHVPDDRAALADLARVLAPEGSLYFSVPLYIGMSETLEFTNDRRNCRGGPTWSYPDHCRDYAVSDLEARLREAGFEFERLEGRPGHADDDRMKLRPNNDAVGRRMGLIYTDVVYRCYLRHDCRR